MNERFEKIVRHPVTIPAVVGAIAFGSGVGLGLILGRRTIKEVTEVTVSDSNQLTLGFDDPEVADYIRERGRIVIEEQAQEELEQKILKTAMMRLADIPPDVDSEPVVLEEIEPVRHSVFADNDDDWDYAEELKLRAENAPYILHRDEFFSEESGYHQESLTYYAQDEILCDQDDKPIYNASTVIGPMKFGHGSGDPNVFYVRNDSRQGEYEVINYSGSYMLEVLGGQHQDEVDNELKHSGLRKLRQE